MTTDDDQTVLQLSVEEFKQRIRIIEGYEAERLRERYIDRFVDTTSDYFYRLIADSGPQGDEVCYTGYLWDTLKHAQLIGEDPLLVKLRAWGDIYAFWDLHNATKIFIENYWKFPLKAVLYGRAVDFLEAISHDANVDRCEDMILPEDVYYFKERMRASLVLTHETTVGGERLCLEAE